MESPFDHLRAIAMKPVYQLQCPLNPNNPKFKCNMPKVFILSARPLADRWDAYVSWSNRQIGVIDTTELSKTIAFQSKRKCLKDSWSSRMFSIYVQVFEDVLNYHPEDGDFIFVEDDAILNDFKSLHSEACMARYLNLQFYSFYRVPGQENYWCIYQVI